MAEFVVDSSSLSAADESPPLNRRHIADLPAVAPPPLLEALNSKVLRIAYRHEELKLSFKRLESQIGTGLREADDVFSALSEQLIKLVGLKTAEMAKEGRYTAITSFEGPRSQDYKNKALKANNELMEKQKLKVVQLIKILKNIKSQVNSSRTSMFEIICACKEFIQKLFTKASSLVSGSGDRYMVLKVLQVTFHHLRATFESVEAGLEEMINELAKKMCNPMVDYVHSLRAEMQAGKCSSLLAFVGEMHEEMKVKELELVKARNHARLSEQRMTEALSRLQKSEETVRILEVEATRNLTRLTAQQSKIEALSRLNNSQETSPSTRQQEQEVKRWEEARKWTRLAQQSRIDAMSKLKKFEETTQKQQEGSSMLREDREDIDDRLMWELLTTHKRKSISDANELPSIGRSNEKPLPKRVVLLPSHSHRPVTRSQFRMAELQSTSSDSKRVLRSSPSTTTQRVLCGKRIIP